MSEIRRVVVRRLRNVVITIFGMITLNFFLIQGIGDPVQILTPRDPKVDEAFRAENCIRFGLCGPDGQPLNIFQRYLIYMENTFTGDWGTSYYWKRPVADLIVGDLAWTLVLISVGTVFYIVLGILIGTFSAARRGKAFDLVATGFSLFFYGMPVFWLALILQLGFTEKQFGLNWWPTFPGFGEYDDRLGLFAFRPDQLVSVLQHLALPSLTLALGFLAGVSLVMRNSLIDVMTEDYVVTARAKGLPERLILRHHVLPNGMPPMVTLIALDMAFVFGGAYQVEYVFSYEGIGWRTIAAIDAADFPVVQAIIVLGGIAVVIGNFLADLVLLKVDPRIKIA